MAAGLSFMVGRIDKKSSLIVQDVSFQVVSQGSSVFMSCNLVIWSSIAAPTMNYVKYDRVDECKCRFRRLQIICVRSGVTVCRCQLG